MIRTDGHPTICTLIPLPPVCNPVATEALWYERPVPVPGRPGYRRDATGNVFYSAAWLDDGRGLVAT